MNRSGLVGKESVVLFGDGDRVLITAGDEPIRFLLVVRAPHRRARGLVLGLS